MQRVVQHIAREISEFRLGDYICALPADTPPLEESWRQRKHADPEGYQAAVEQHLERYVVCGTFAARTDDMVLICDQDGRNRWFTLAEVLAVSRTIQ